MAASLISVNFAGAMVSKTTTNQTVSANTDTIITWDTEEYDTDGIADLATNNDRLTVPSGASRVRLTWCVYLSDQDFDSNDVISLYPKKNGSTFAGSGMAKLYPNASTSSPVLGGTSAVVSVSSGDYFQLSIKHTASTSATVATGSYICFFALEVIS